MEKPTLYKKVPIVDAMNRSSRSLTASEQTQANTIINKFFELFIQANS